MLKHVVHRIVMAGLVVAGLALHGRSAPIPVADRGGFDDAWADLAKDEGTASRALLKLAAKPKEARAFLKDKLKPLKIDEKRVRELLADLGSEKEETWKAAVEELEYFDPRLAIDLQTLMNDVTERVARAHLVSLLSGPLHPADSLLEKNVPIKLSQYGGKNGEEVYYNFVQGGSWWAESRVSLINFNNNRNMRKYWTRAVRAMALLEHNGSDAAMVVLEDMATGHADAQPTRVAKEAIARLKKAKEK